VSLAECRAGYGVTIDLLTAVVHTALVCHLQSAVPVTVSPSPVPASANAAQQGLITQAQMWTVLAL
jgi:hypothetical protein